MAASTGTFTTTVAKGNREDLSNVISNLSPVDTPFLGLIGNGTLGNVVASWQTERNAGPDLNNAHSEGADFAAQTRTPTTVLSNTAQIFKKNAKVSRTQEKVKSAGRTSEMAHQIEKAGKELKTDIEAILLSTQARSDGDPRKTRSFEHFIAQNGISNHGTGFSGATTETTAITDESAKRSFTEDLLKTVLNAGWEAGARPSHMLVGIYSKARFNGFKGREASRVTVDADTIMSNVDYYLSDAGELFVIPARNMRKSSALLIDPSLVKARWLSKYEVSDVNVTMDGKVREIVSEMALEVTDPAGHMSITGLATSAGEEPAA